MKGIIGTAGHIDHGKTALIGALTGEETDRLPEERKRGISIDLGFSHLDVGDTRLGIVDVPGHEDFIRNMLAGATGIDVLLLVVAADEGVMPQTREHAAIGELLGVERAVVALTKVDLVDDGWLGLVHDDLADFLADTPFAGATVVPTSTVDGTGIEELRTALVETFQGGRGREDDLFRMPVDRAFTVRGTGTVLTGTVWSGRLEDGATLRLLPDGPEARVRGLQVHGGDVEAVAAGERAAIALAGVDREAVERGMTAVAGAGWAPSSRLTVRLRVLPGTRWSIEDRQRVRVHLGTAEVMARAVLLDRDAGGARVRALGPGDEGWAQLRLEAPLVARAGDRFVVRSYSPVTTIGGGVVAEPDAAPRKAVADDEARLLATLLEGGEGAARALLETAGAGGVPVDALPLRARLTPAGAARVVDGAVVAGDRVFHPGALEAVRAATLEAVERFHRDHPLELGMDPGALRRAAAGSGGSAGAAGSAGSVGAGAAGAREALVERALDGLLAEGALVADGGRVARSGWTVTPSPEVDAELERIGGALAEAGAAAPRTDELADTLALDPARLATLLTLLESRGAVVRIEHDLYADAAVMEAAVAAIRERFAGRDGLSPGDFREVLDVSRRHLMPLLGWLDQAGVTVRAGEGRSVTGGDGASLAPPGTGQ